MQKKILIALIVGVCFIALFSSALTAWSPAKFSLWPGVWSVPSNADIKGVNFGFVTFGQKKKTLAGADLALLLGHTPNISGVQMSIVNKSENVGGAQLAFLGNFCDNLSGMQLASLNSVCTSKSFFQMGILNFMETSKSGFQLGLINAADSKSYGFQFGFFNIMENGFLPVTLFFNYSSPPKETKTKIKTKTKAKTKIPLKKKPSLFSSIFSFL